MSETTDYRCRWAGTESPRLLRGHRQGCDSDRCDGCQPCPERHCRRCNRAHVTTEGRGTDQTCADCLADAREDLAHCWLTPELVAEALTSGVDSEAAMLVGPVGDPDIWQRRHRLVVNAAMAADGNERHPAYRALVAWMADCRDERHPLWVLGTWEDAVREHLDQPAPDHRAGCGDGRCDGCNAITGPRARDYLNDHLTRLAHDPEFGFEQLASDLSACRNHLETAARNSRRPETGAPCIKCGRAHLVKDYGETPGDDVKWTCPKCGEWWDEQTYRSKVAAVYMTKATALTASQIAATYRVPEGTVRQWAARGHVRRRGYDGQRRQLYDVGDTLAQRDKEAMPA